MVGRVSTNGSDGYPYTVAVHFVYREGAVYFHGLPKGEKLCNIARDPKVCFEVDELLGIRKEGVTVPCKVGSGYESAVLRGRASLVDDPGENGGHPAGHHSQSTPRSLGQGHPSFPRQQRALLW